MLSKLSIEEFEHLADENAKEVMKDIERVCHWSLDGYKLNQPNKVQHTLMKAVTKRVAIKMGVVTLTNKYTT
jgi:hypothetical protein